MARSQEYEAVLKSERWRAFSLTLRNGGTCEACRRQVVGPGALQAHHWHYGTLGQEDTNDVSALCSDCHRFADAFRGKIIDLAKKAARREGRPWRPIAKWGGLALAGLERNNQPEQLECIYAFLVAFSTDDEGAP